MLNIIFMTFICLIPVVFWAYIFSSMQEQKFNSQSFIMGILAWWLSVIPILYMEKMMKFVKMNFMNFFEYAKNLTWFFSTMNFSISLSLFLFFLVFVSFLVWFLMNSKVNMKMFFYDFVVFMLFSFFMGGFFYLMWKFNFLNNSVKTDELFFWNVVFDSLKLVIFYYILVAFMEEATKHFNFLSSSLFQMKTMQDGVLYAIFVALWFSFIENILYVYNSYTYSFFDLNLLSVYFFSSIFSMMLHVFCSSMMAYFFTKAYLNFWFSKWLYLKVFVMWVFFSVLIHFMFNMFLEFWFNFMMILFFVMAYLYIASIFYKE